VVFRAGTPFVLPSLLILIILSWVSIAFGDMPLLASTHGELKFTAPLTGISARWSG
jgi:chromate transport protein ChrA